MRCSRPSLCFNLQTTVQAQKKKNQKETKAESESENGKPQRQKSQIILSRQRADLWDEAYVNLKSQEPQQLKRYEEIVMRWLEANSIKYAPHQILIDKPPDDGFAVHSLQWRKTAMLTGA